MTTDLNMRMPFMQDITDITLGFRLIKFDVVTIDIVIVSIIPFVLFGTVRI